MIDLRNSNYKLYVKKDMSGKLFIEVEVNKFIEERIYSEIILNEFIAINSRTFLICKDTVLIRVDSFKK